MLLLLLLLCYCYCYCYCYYYYIVIVIYYMLLLYYYYYIYMYILGLLYSLLMFLVFPPLRFYMHSVRYCCMFLMSNNGIEKKIIMEVAVYFKQENQSNILLSFLFYLKFHCPTAIFSPLSIG